MTPVAVVSTFNSVCASSLFDFDVHAEIYSDAGSQSLHAKGIIGSHAIEKELSGSRLFRALQLPATLARDFCHISDDRRTFKTAQALRFPPWFARPGIGGQPPRRTPLHLCAGVTISVESSAMSKSGPSTVGEVTAWP